MKRRQFAISTASLAGLSILFGPSAFAALGRASDCKFSDPLMARGHFESLKGQRFTARFGETETKLRLNTVTSAVRGYEKEQFHVLFDALPGQALPEGIYYLKANQAATLGLHLLPGELVAGQQKMVASFNLMTAT